MPECTNAFASVVDIVPTLLQYTGVSASSDAPALSGKSMVSLLSGQSAQIYSAEVVISQELSGGVAIYQGDYKLVRNVPPYGDRKWHLYNLKNDLTESNDLAVSEPERVKSMADAYAEYSKKNGVVEVPDDYDINAQAIKNAGMKH